MGRIFKSFLGRGIKTLAHTRSLARSLMALTAAKTCNLSGYPLLNEEEMFLIKVVDSHACSQPKSDTW